MLEISVNDLRYENFCLKGCFSTRTLMNLKMYYMLKLCFFFWNMFNEVCVCVLLTCFKIVCDHSTFDVCEPYLFIPTFGGYSLCLDQFLGQSFKLLPQMGGVQHFL